MGKVAPTDPEVEHGLGEVRVPGHARREPLAGEHGQVVVDVLDLDPDPE